MKIKFTSTWSIVATAMAVFMSACGSNVSVAKRYHSGGFNISWGGGDEGGKVASKTTSKKPVIKKVGKSAANTEEALIATTVPMTSNEVRSTQALKATQENAAIVAEQQSTAVGVNKSRNSIQNEVVKSAAASKQVVKNAKESSGPGKSQIIALVLALLVGVIGVHRFYLGYPMEGVLQIITLGGCVIWTLIDIFRIITGDLQPADGEYEETL